MAKKKPAKRKEPEVVNVDFPTYSKRMTVTFEENPLRPTFEFEGTWTGHDAKVVRNLFWREYLLHQRATRATAIKPQEAIQ